MWHKVSPISFRIPYIQTWKSSWFADKKGYRDSLAIDLKVREILKKELTGIPVGDILISREQDFLNVDIYTAKAALIVGKTGEQVEIIKKKIENKVGLKTNVNVKEIKKPLTATKREGLVTLSTNVFNTWVSKRGEWCARSPEVEDGIWHVLIRIDNITERCEASTEEVELNREDLRTDHRPIRQPL